MLVDQETFSVKDSNDELDPVPIEKTDNKMLFVYQSKVCKYYTSDMRNT